MILSSDPLPNGLPSSPLSRRKLLIRIAWGVWGILWLSGLVAHHNAGSVQFRHETLSLEGLPPELHGLGILQATDPHIGGIMNDLVKAVSDGVHGLLEEADPKNTIVLHGGDFVSRKVGLIPATTRDDIKKYAPEFLDWLERFTNLAVPGNHDEANPEFDLYMRAMLEDKHNMQFLEKPDQISRFHYNGQEIAVHGLHTLWNYLETIPKEQRDEILDEFMRQCNHGVQACNVVVLHNPDGLQYVLERLQEVGKKLEKKTIFFAGHAHGSMIDLPVMNRIWLGICGVKHNRYKGWYGAEWEFAETGDWQMYVSTGAGNSPYLPFRMNADPEVVCFRFWNTQAKNPRTA